MSCQIYTQSVCMQINFLKYINFNGSFTKNKMCLLNEFLFLDKSTFYFARMQVIL